MAYIKYNLSGFSPTTRLKLRVTVSSEVNEDRAILVTISAPPSTWGATTDTFEWSWSSDKSLAITYMLAKASGLRVLAVGSRLVENALGRSPWPSRWLIRIMGVTPPSEGVIAHSSPSLYPNAIQGSLPLDVGSIS